MIDQWALCVFGYAAMAKRIPKPADASSASDRLSIRLDLVSGARIGPGKIAVLEEIARSGSISAGGRGLRMSYRRTCGRDSGRWQRRRRCGAHTRGKGRGGTLSRD